jgi:hypothetical protein
MAKLKSPHAALFDSSPSRSRRVLILPRFLAEKAKAQASRDSDVAN